jgi:protein arginine N-methyltransferase 1
MEKVYKFEEENFKDLKTAFSNFSKDPLQSGEKLNYYFDSYSQIHIHYEMLSDYIRTEAYQKAILDNKHLFKDKVVMDIGCGTGILSMFACSAGAKKVYAIEKASVFRLAMEIVKENKMNDRIQIINDTVENIQLDEKVDIIVSEWMGYLLLYEGMFDSVKIASDKFLNEGGMLFPNKATFTIAGVFDRSVDLNNMGYYQEIMLPNIKSHNYSSPKSNNTMAEFFCIKNVLADLAIISSNKVKTSNNLFHKIDLEKVTIPELDFKANFEVIVSENGFLNGLVLWWDTSFTHGKIPIVLDTSPFKESTHWKQGVFNLKHTIAVLKGDVVKGVFFLKKNDLNHRNVDIRIDYFMENKYGKVQETMFYFFQ